MWKSSSRMLINPPVTSTLMRQRWSSTTFISVFYLPYSCKHQINTHTWQLLPCFSLRQQCFYFRQKLLFDSCSLFSKLEREPPLNIPPLRSYSQRGVDLARVADTKNSCMNAGLRCKQRLLWRFSSLFSDPSQLTKAELLQNLLSYRYFDP